jgi:hypothetical protein
LISHPETCAVLLGAVGGPEWPPELQGFRPEHGCSVPGSPLMDSFSNRVCRNSGIETVSGCMGQHSALSIPFPFTGGDVLAAEIRSHRVGGFRGVA